MSTYLVLGTYNAAGREGLIVEGGTSRRTETKHLFETQLGGRVHYYAFLMGKYDFVLIVELPSDDAFVSPILLGTAGGKFTVESCKVISPEDMDSIAASTRELRFRSAGE